MSALRSIRAKSQQPMGAAGLSKVRDVSNAHYLHWLGREAAARHPIILNSDGCSAIQAGKVRPGWSPAD